MRVVIAADTGGPGRRYIAADGERRRTMKLKHRVVSVIGAVLAIVLASGAAASPVSAETKQAAKFPGTFYIARRIMRLTCASPHMAVYGMAH
jgi:hypothetical protein